MRMSKMGAGESKLLRVVAIQAGFESQDSGGSVISDRRSGVGLERQGRNNAALEEEDQEEGSLSMSSSTMCLTDQCVCEVLTIARREGHDCTDPAAAASNRTRDSLTIMHTSTPYQRLEQRSDYRKRGPGTDLLEAGYGKYGSHGA